MKIFVGNLSGEITEDDLRQTFEGFGQVRSVTIVTDESEGKPLGFGFVTMPLANEAKNAIKKMDGKDFKGKKISVEKSRTNAKARSLRRRRNRSGIGDRADKSRGNHSGSRRRKRRH